MAGGTNTSASPWMKRIGIYRVVLRRGVWNKPFERTRLRAGGKTSSRRQNRKRGQMEALDQHAFEKLCEVAVAAVFHHEREPRVHSRVQHHGRSSHRFAEGAEDGILAIVRSRPSANKREILFFGCAHRGRHLAGEPVVAVIVEHAVKPKLVEHGGILDLTQQTIGEAVHQHNDAAAALCKRGGVVPTAKRAVQIVPLRRAEGKILQMYVAIEPLSREMPPLNLLVHNGVVGVDAPGEGSCRRASRQRSR